MLQINNNTIDLARYRGVIRRCPHCTPERLLSDPSGKTCASCLGHGFVAMCKNCGGDGLYKGSASAFGGGDVPHMSTCNPCGGTGMFAVRKPEGWKDQPTVGTPDASTPATASALIPDPAIVPALT